MRILNLPLLQEQDVVGARQRARQIAELLGFKKQDLARIATAVSEIARNAFNYAGGGEVEFFIKGNRPPQSLGIRVKDKGPGIADLPLILGGKYRSATGMGLGIIGAHRLMDDCSVSTVPGQTIVTMSKAFSAGTQLLTALDVRRLVHELELSSFANPIDEVARQNSELICALSELQEHQDELIATNGELEDTNRGVVALYAELEERANLLRDASQNKTRFLSSMSHELRTPLHSIRALTRLLLDRVDGPLSDEQAIQVEFISKAGRDLTQLVDDLLDLAKIEAGKSDIRSAPFAVDDLFSTLRGMLRPLLHGEAVVLRFDDAAGLPAMVGDEGKLSQILRNLVSNAIKFTERGEIRVCARLAQDGATMNFRVADTGIGIAQEDQERIFEEFAQVLGPLQAQVKGTGLGLSLCRRLAQLLGGSIAVQSSLGQGSTFVLAVPVSHAGVADASVQPPPGRCRRRPDDGAGGGAGHARAPHRAGH